MIIILNDKEESVTFEEFKNRISSGELGPKIKLKDSYLTSNEWRTIDNLRLFHKLSPEKYPYGSIFEQEEEIREKREAEERKIGQLRGIYFQAVNRLNEELEEKIRSELIQKYSNLEGVEGLSEFVAVPSFGVKTHFHFVFRNAEIEIIMSKCPKDPMDLPLSLDDTPETALEKAKQGFGSVDLVKKSVAIAQAPEAINTWQKLIELSTDAKNDPENEDVAVLDGVIYANTLLTESPNRSAVWHSPESYGQLNAQKLVNSYTRLIIKSGLNYGVYLLPSKKELNEDTNY